MATPPRIAVVDYGYGNLRSVAKALEACALRVDVTGDPADLERADAVVLPGVGVASEYDFVGYDYTTDYKRDYDRGFFMGAEAWYANARNLHFEPAISSGGSRSPPFSARATSVRTS